MRPTCGSNAPNVEPHLLDFSGNLFGADLSAALAARLRPEAAFLDVADLVTKIEADCARERKIPETPARRPPQNCRIRALRSDPIRILRGGSRQWNCPQLTFATVALLIDGDNISATYAGQILRKAGSQGPLTVRRVYGNATGIMGWADAPSFRVMHAGHGKNGADLLLAVDAMELALAREFEAFVIVTSDGDFSHLAHRLREMGKHVLGIGEELKAPQHFRKACVEYVDLKRPATAATDDGLPALDRDIMEVIRSMDSAGNGAPVAQFNVQMRRRHTDFKISEQEQKTWGAYFSKRPELYKLAKIGTETRVSIALRNNDP